MSNKSPQLLILLLVLMGGAAVLLLQNSQSLGLILLGRAIPFQLPLSLWVILAAIAGMVMSVLLQLLLGSESQQEATQPKQRFESFKKRPEREPDKRTGRSDWERSRAGYDWTDKELEQEDEAFWDIESPPERPTRPRPPQDSQPSTSLRRSRSNPPVPEEIRPQPQPERPRPEPIVDSERPSPQKTRSPEDGVVDANYRVITPPYSPDEEEPLVNIEDDPEWI